MKIDAVAWMVAGGKLYQNRAFTSEAQADKAVLDRNDGAEKVPLYDQRAIDILRAEVAKWRRQAQFETDVATNAISQAERAEAEADALRKDAERYRHIAADHGLAWESEIDDEMARFKQAAE